MARPRRNGKNDFAAVRDLARQSNVSVAWVVRHAVHTLIADNLANTLLAKRGTAAEPA
jgi:hypothetical protein